MHRLLSDAESDYINISAAFSESSDLIGNYNLCDRIKERSNDYNLYNIDCKIP